jgi:hypothetical protein
VTLVPRTTLFVIAQAVSVLAGCATLAGALVLNTEVGCFAGYSSSGTGGSATTLAACLHSRVFAGSDIGFAATLAVAGIVLPFVALRGQEPRLRLPLAQVALWACVLPWSFWALTRLHSHDFTGVNGADFSWMGVGDALAVAAIVLLAVALRQPRRPAMR